MNTLNFDRLWSLLPAVHRVRDEGRGELRDLVHLFAEQFAALEENTDQLYDDLFIETCADWVAPYIGDLIGYRTLHGVVPAVASPRADVANTIAYRRRKGTATMLEQMARDVSGWPAHAVEFFEQLATSQYMNHLRLHAPATPDLRDTDALIKCGAWHWWPTPVMPAAGAGDSTRSVPTWPCSAGPTPRPRSTCWHSRSTCPSPWACAQWRW